MIGWTSSGFYLSSRLSQIWKNWCRKSAEGLSMAMFACAIAANLSYGLGIIIRSYHWEDVVSSAPWLLGSLGTVTLDMVIFLQVGLAVQARKRCYAWATCEQRFCLYHKQLQGIDSLRQAGKGLPVGWELQGVKIIWAASGGASPAALQDTTVLGSNGSARLQTAHVYTVWGCMCLAGWNMEGSIVNL